MTAEVVGSPLEQTGNNGQTQRASDQRQVVMKELVLQVPRAGGDHDTVVGQQRRHEISKGLAGTGASLPYQRAVVSERTGNSLGQMLLLLAGGEIGKGLCKRSLLSEQGNHISAVNQIGFVDFHVHRPVPPCAGDRSWRALILRELRITVHWYLYSCTLR